MMALWRPKKNYRKGALSYGQLSYWSTYFLKNEPLNTLVQIEIHFDLDIVLFFEAIKHTITSNQALVAQLYRWLPFQRFIELDDIRIEYLDYCTLNHTDLEVERAKLSAIWNQKLRMRTPPHCRIGVIKLADDRYVLIMAFSHISVDAKSITKILEQIASNYSTKLVTGKFSQGQSSNSLERYISREREAIGNSRSLADAEKKWEVELKNASSFRVPEKSYETQILKSNNPRRSASSNYSRELSYELVQVGVKYKMSIQMVLVAGIVAGLLKNSNQKDLTTLILNDTRLDLEDADVVGPLISKIALRTVVDETTKLPDILMDVRKSLLRNYSDRTIPVLPESIFFLQDHPLVGRLALWFSTPIAWLVARITGESNTFAKILKHSFIAHYSYWLSPRSYRGIRKVRVVINVFMNNFVPDRKGEGPMVELISDSNFISVDQSVDSKYLDVRITNGESGGFQIDLRGSGLSDEARAKLMEEIDSVFHELIANDL